MSGWSVLVPVKKLAQAKRRMSLDTKARAELVLAMLRDTLTALRGASNVTTVRVVTTDAAVATVATAEGASVLGYGGNRDLNEDLRCAARHLSQATPTPIAVFLADLPCLTDRAAEQVLAAAPTHTAGFLADASGRGTAVLCTPRHVDFTPAFEGVSARKHQTVGRPIRPRPGWSGARQDVDLIADLQRALQIGVGQHTATWIRMFERQVSTIMTTPPLGSRGYSQTTPSWSASVYQ